MTKVRTIKETIKELRAIDPGCQLTEWQLRQLVKEEKIPEEEKGTTGDEMAGWHHQLNGQIGRAHV